MKENQSTASDFNRNANALTELIRAATTYSRMTATPEETDAMLDRAYGKGRTPGYEGRRWDRARSEFLCEQCGASLGRGFRFCSLPCWHQWRREHPPERPEGPTAAELVEEMQAALDELRAYVEEREG